MILVVIGLWFFATTTLGLDLPRVDWGALWPLLLIGLGAWIVLGAIGPPTVTTRTVSVDWEPGDRSLTDRLWLADWRSQVDAPLRRGPRRSQTPTRKRRSHTGARAGNACSATTRSRRSPLRSEPRSGLAISTTTQHSGSPCRSSRPRPRAPGALALELPNSGQDTLSFSRLGRIELPLPNGVRSLSVFWMAGYAGGLFIPFRDATNGAETYPAGRYLVDGAKGADLGGDPEAGTITVDFNYRVSALVRLRPAMGLPARATRESSRHTDLCRRTPRLKAANEHGRVPSGQ